MKLIVIIVAGLLLSGRATHVTQQPTSGKREILSVSQMTSERTGAEACRYTDETRTCPATTGCRCFASGGWNRG